LPQTVICVELTERCNNACRHCYNYWRSDGRMKKKASVEQLSRSEIRYLIKKVKRDIPLKYVALTGGEPCLRADLPEIVADLTDEGISSVIITNGVLVNRSVLKRLPQGIHFEITLLGHKAEIHNRLAGRAVFERIVRNVIQIEKLGHHTTIGFVAVKANALDAFQVAELAIVLGANTIMYNRINLSRGSLPYANDLVPTRSMFRDSLGQISDASSKYGITAVCSVPIPPCVVDPRDFPKLHFGWCPRGGAKSYYTISSTGLLRPCNHSSLVLGDLRSHTFAELLATARNKAFWKAIPSACIECQHPLKKKCRGGCTAASAEFYGTQQRMDPLCEYANN
jgi:radical SAM protein with 4Fe4S-binding SPASM domain